MTISTGIDAIVVTRPDIIAAIKCRGMPSSNLSIDFAESFAWEYVPNWAAFTTIARAIVGVAPLHRVKIPSSRL